MGSGQRDQAVAARAMSDAWRSLPKRPYGKESANKLKNWIMSKEHKPGHAIDGPASSEKPMRRLTTTTTGLIKDQ